MHLQPRVLALVWLAILAAVPLCPAPERPLPTGDAVIRARAGDSEIVITTTSRLAGAIHSLTWGGREFIDSVDHGRQLQSASNLDAGGRLIPETFNPTEAGSRKDGAGTTSSSKLLHLIVHRHRLQTSSQMAFWLPPGETSSGHPAKNETVLSNHTLTKRVTIGYRDLPHVIQYDVTFGLPVDERHHLAQFEVVTGYMPTEFDTFLKFNPQTGQLEELSDGPGEQPFPVVLSTADGKFAMGCYSPDRFGEGWSGPGYGRFRFVPEKVVKWNCVFRYQSSSGVQPGDYSFRSFVIVGDQAIVRQSLARLHGLQASGKEE